MSMTKKYFAPSATKVSGINSGLPCVKIEIISIIFVGIFRMNNAANINVALLLRLRANNKRNPSGT